MADDTEINIDIDVTGDKTIKNASDSLAAMSANLKEAASSINQVVREMDKLERGSAGVATTGKQVSRGADKASGSLKGWAQSMASVNKATLTSPQNNLYDSYMADQKAFDQTQKFKVSQAQNANAQIIRDEEATRNKELSSLRGAIQERAKADNQKYAQARNANAQILADEQTTRAKELANLRGAIQERNKVEQDGANRRAAQNKASLIQEQKDSDAQRKKTLANLKADIVSRSGETKQTGTFKDFLTNISTAGNDLPRIRYAMFDIAQSLTVVGVGLTAVSALTVKTAIEWEKNFASVQRTTGVTGAAAMHLKENLIDLAQTLPVSFEQITSIAAMAGQLGVAADATQRFTETTAKFSATTNVGVEAASTAFGRLDSLLPDVQGRYENLASSILGVGINSVATESEIIAITSQIAATGAQAGLTADEVIGLAGSFASLGVAPEAARGTVLRVFSQINTAITSGGQRLDDLAKTAGVTADVFQSRWGQAGGFTELFPKFLAGIASEGAQAETALRALGITSTRDINSMLKLAQNSGDVSTYLALANEEFDKGTLLGDNFAVIADTISAKLQVLANSFQSVVASMGDSALGPIGFLVDRINELLKGFENIVSTPLGQTISGVIIVVTALAAALSLLTAGTAAAFGGFLAYKTVVTSSIVTTLGLTGAVNSLNAALKVAFVSAGWIGGIALVGTAIAGMLEAFGAFDDATTRAQKFFGTVEGFSEAIKADKATYEKTGEAIKVYSTAYDSVSDPANKAKDATELWLGVQDKVEPSVTGASSAISDQTLVLGENADAWIRNMLSKNEGIQKLANDPVLLKAFSDFGGNIDDLIAAGLQGKSTEYLDGLAAKAAKLSEESPDLTVFKQFDKLDEVLAPALSAIDSLIAGQIELQNTNDFLAGSNGDLGDSYEERTDQILQDVDAIYEASNAQQDLIDKTSDLGKAFADSGADAAANGQAMQALISSIVTADPSTAANRLQGLFDALVSGGYASTYQLSNLLAVINALGGSTGAVAFDMSAFKQGMVKAGRAAGGAAKEIRTLVDYANDLGKVFERAFDIRFSSQTALDKITSSWQDLNDELAEYQQKVNELTADRAITAYFLQVAEAYNDTLRAGVLRAKLADTDKELADAQEVTNKTLNGNSKAAITNRKTITDLVSDYQDYIKSLAESGASQATLKNAISQSKQDFIAQATALGFNATQLGKYTKSFDDMAVAVAKVPRNITVTANTNPALQALNEFIAKAAKSGGSAGSAWGNSFRDAIEPAIKAALSRKPIPIQGEFIFTNGAGKQQVYKVPGTTLKLFKDGGYINGAGTGTSDSVPIMASNTEYMLKSKSVASLGVPLLNYMNKYGRIPGFAAGGPIGGGSSAMAMPGTLEVQLSATDRRLLAAAGNVTLKLDGRIVADSTNNVNGVYAKRGQ